MILTIAIGLFVGERLNFAVVDYLYQNYYFNKTAHSLDGLLVNIGVIILSVYLVFKFLIIPSKQKLIKNNSENSNLEKQ